MTLNFQPIFFPILVLAAYASLNTLDFTISKAFTTLSIIGLLAGPLLEVLGNISQVAAAAASFGRIQDFLTMSSNDDSTSIEQITLLRTSHEQGNMLLKKNIWAVLVDANIGVKMGESAVLKGLSLGIQSYMITVIVGPVGSGKSMLLKALIGEALLISGNVNLAHTSIALCKDEAWLINSPILTNILAGEACEEGWYNTVLDACGIEDNFQTLAHDVDVEIGSMGSSLSGGQRQRVLRIILVTTFSRAKLPKGFSLSENWPDRPYGLMPVALARAVYSRKQVLLLDDPFSGLDTDTTEVIRRRLLGPTGLLKRTRRTLVLATNTRNNLSYADDVIVLSGDGTLIVHGSYESLAWQGHLVSISKTDRSTQRIRGSRHTQNATRRTGDFSAYAYYLKSFRREHTLIFLTAFVLRVFSVTFPQVWLQRWSEANEASPGDHLGMYIGVYTMFGVLGIFIVIVPRSANNLHNLLLDAVMHAPYSFIFSTDTGIILNRFSQDMTLIDSQLPSAFLQTVVAVAGAIGGGILIAAGSKFMAATVPVCIALLYMLQKFYLRLSRQVRLMDLEAKSPLFTHFTETLHGLQTIRAFDWQERQILTCLAVVLVTLAVNLRGSTSSGSMGVALVSILGFNQILAQAIIAWTNLETSIGAIIRTNEFVTDILPESQPTTPAYLLTLDASYGSVEFKNVTASYVLGESPVIRDVSLSIKAGQKVAICGRSGGGKSSLLLLLARMFDPSHGTITVGGVSLDDLHRQDVRSQITFIPQDPVLLPGSVRFNADPSGETNDDDILAAVHRVGLGSSFSNKETLDRDMKSVPLSRGQKQLLGIARAMLRKGSIIVMDEATSGLDAEGDQAVRDLMKGAWKDKTVVAIMYKLHLVEDFDQVAVVEAGHIVEFGDPRVLSTDAGSFFAKLSHGRQ
ncbi:hypothetical protein MMC25_004598 [Agyrium rufum]|nr:hypothetical protein [Agyrium rufum]